jgi:hypothetical protein
MRRVDWIELDFLSMDWIGLGFFNFELRGLDWIGFMGGKISMGWIGLGKSRRVMDWMGFWFGQSISPLAERHTEIYEGPAVHKTQYRLAMDM